MGLVYLGEIEPCVCRHAVSKNASCLLYLGFQGALTYTYLPCYVKALCAFNPHGSWGETNNLKLIITGGSVIEHLIY